MYIYHIFFIHSSFGGHLGRFHILAIVHSAVMNIRILVSLQGPDFNYFKYIARSRIAGSYGRTGKPSMLQCMGLQRVRHDLAAEQE